MRKTHRRKKTIQMEKNTTKRKGRRGRHGANREKKREMMMRERKSEREEMG